MKHNYCLIVLASGLSQRFGNENKLLALLGEKRIAKYSAGLWQERPLNHKIVVVPPHETELSQIYAESGWNVIVNSNPKDGLSSSLKHGVRYAKHTQVDGVIVSLADMPYIDDVHITKVARALATNDAVMCKSTQSMTPPAGFRNSLFDDILSLTGQNGAKSIYLSAAKRAEIELPDNSLIDIDTITDLKVANKMRVLNA